MDVLLRSDWLSRMQAATACAAIGLLSAIVLGVF
jgi:hypothetical protein